MLKGKEWFEFWDEFYKWGIEKGYDKWNVKFVMQSLIDKGY